MTRFFRLSGGGNDFLALVEPTQEPAAAEIHAWCQRGLSAGADGLFILDRRPDAVGMAYFNADGHRADLCLNGTRCAVQLAAHLGWAENDLEIATDSGRILGRVLDTTTVALQVSRPGSPQERHLALDGKDHSGWQIDVGVPHFVLQWPRSLADAPVASLGAALRHHESWGTPGVNVDFVRFVDRHRFEIRTFERGVEAETLACGSGVIACAATGLTLEALDLPVKAQTLGGFEIEVGPPLAEGSGDCWSLTGDARLIAEGTLYPGALEVPAPPIWSD